MAKSIMVIATESGTGKSVVSLGLCDAFARHGARVAYFKPVGDDSDGNRDDDVTFIKRGALLPQPAEDMVALGPDDVASAIQGGRYDDAIDRIIEKHGKLAREADVIICEGVDSVSAFPALESDINIDFAKNVDASMVLVASAAGRDTDEVISYILVARSRLVERGAGLAGVFVNRVDPRHHADLCDQVRRRLAQHDIPFFGALPELRVLSAPRLTDVVRKLDATVISGDKEALEARIGDIVVVAMGLEHALHYVKDNCLIITPGDREEILLAAAACHACKDAVRPAGVVLTGGFEPRRKVMELVTGLAQRKLPILRVDTNTFDTAIAVHDVHPALEEGQEDKAFAIRRALEEYADLDRLLGQKIAASTPVITPRRFLRELRERAGAAKKTIVLPEGNVDRMIKAAEVLRMHDSVNLIMLGDEGEIRGQAKQLGVTLDDHVEVVDFKKDRDLDKYIHTLVELRRHKGVNEDIARDLLMDRNYYGTMMVHMNRAQGMVSGSTTTTQATLRPAFEIIKTKPGITSVSSVFFMCLPDRVLVYGDCAVIPKPTAQQLAEIALMSAETATAFGIEPRVAMLSYSTGESGKGPDVDLVREATNIVRSHAPKFEIEGPIQYDAAIDPIVAKTKLPDSKVAGRATVFVFPDLNTGNNTYKAVQRSAHAIAIGPVLQGLNKPVNDLSRGATVTDIVNTVVITAILAQGADAPRSER
ncbi:phosphate acetyltransferase [Myxococcota bacterium]|nr:phosphate acetyltransferase [Myxococcota bacterium]